MQITTERLVLRDYEEQDWRRVFQYRSDPLYRRYYPEEISTESASREFVAMTTGWAREEPRTKFQLAIVCASDGVLIGSCGVRLSSENFESGRDFGSEAEFGCELDPRYWNQGYAAEAGRAMIGFAFDQLKVHRVFACTFAENQPSAKLAERLGMRLEGRLRERRYFKGRWWDHLYYSVLVEEWRA